MLILTHFQSQSCGSDSFIAVLSLVTQSCLTFCNPMGYSLPSSSVCGDSPGKNTGLSFSSLGIFPTQGLNPGLLHCGQILYQLSHKGSPRILEWVAYPFSSESSWSRNWTGVSWITGGFFTNWAIREAPVVTNLLANAGDIRGAVSIPGLGRPLGERQGNPLQYSCLENSEDRGASVGFST